MSPAVKMPDSLSVEISLSGQKARVGTLAWRNRHAFFQYDPTFLRTGIQLSPFKLPLGEQLFAAEPVPFAGMFGLFNDSLPDGWGRLLLDRSLIRAGVHPGTLTPLARLAHVGTRGMGALMYRPGYLTHTEQGDVDLDMLAEGAHQVLAGDAQQVIDQLLDLNGSSGGARPKILVGVRGDHIVHGVDDLPAGHEHWLIKFTNSEDLADNGAVEAAYARMAQAAGIEMMPTRLFPAKAGPGYFGTQRFDRLGNERRHVHTVCGLIDAPHNAPSISYETLLKVTRALTRDQVAVEQMFGRMAFNVMAHNRDDHTKHHSFMLVGDDWLLSPAYDLTFSPGPGGEHNMDVAGNGRNPGEPELLAVARVADIPEKRAREIIDITAGAVSQWETFAKEFGVSAASSKRIANTLRERLNDCRPNFFTAGPGNANSLRRTGLLTNLQRGFHTDRGSGRAD